ncbi:hypothetical protein CYMTET_48648 [Cymbomonas tetramitiformis]|uniref:PHD-type domain-containing protein n=1 Tax=Cymbomonas tetramitiformis TaxID=36881 RepID=A0AAE0BTP0_9CHLO|nr:hypothetical protein CYMTET_48648 [Cymbomonas tetramitiformis]
MTEHYSRFIVCVPIPNKEAATIAAAFRNHVLAVFGAPAECLVDGGKEFEGEFEQLCRDCLIDRRVTLPDSPEGDGLTERVVKIIKFCSKKIALEKGLDYEWDELLWSLVVSYNAAKQESTGVAPFTLLFAQEATVPPDLKKAPILDFEKEAKDEKDSRVADLTQRALVFKVGDFVYIRPKPRIGMEVATKPAILKLVKVQRDGVVVLEDSAKLKEKTTVQNIAPCHLQVKDQYDCSAARPSKHFACEVCKCPDGEAYMLLCDTCNRGYHIWCLTPALDRVPEEDWQCPRCLGRGTEAAFAEVSPQLVEKLGKKEQELRQGLASGLKLLPADVGPNRIVKEGKQQPWQALSRKQLAEVEGMMGDLPDRVNWGRQEILTEMVGRLMPGFWHEGHRTVLSKKCAEQKSKAKEMRSAPRVPALAEEEVKRRGAVKDLTKAQVRVASALNWGMELIITAPNEVRRLSAEVDWKSVSGVWDPWAGTGIIGEVMKEQWSHLSVMNNDWNSQLGWPEALNALQPGNYGAWRKKYGVCDAVITSPWFTVLDLAFLLAILANRVVACIHVPSYFLTDMTEIRARYFRELS